MANDLATLTSLLATQLRDTSNEVWTNAEKQNLIQLAVARLYPRVLKYTTVNVPVDQGASFFTVGGPTTPFVKIHRIDLWDTDPTSRMSRMVMEIPGRSWEVQGEVIPGESIRVVLHPTFSYNSSYYMVVHGFTQFDLTNNQIPDYLVPLVLARARAEAYRRAGADRVQFKNWLVSNQTQNVSVNELLQLIREAADEAEMEERKFSSRHSKPVVARR